MRWVRRREEYDGRMVESIFELLCVRGSHFLLVYSAVPENSELTLALSSLSDCPHLSVHILSLLLILWLSFLFCHYFLPPSPASSLLSLFCAVFCLSRELNCPSHFLFHLLRLSLPSFSSHSPTSLY